MTKKQKAKMEQQSKRWVVGQRAVWKDGYKKATNDAEVLLDALEGCLDDMRSWTKYNKMEFRICEAIKTYKGIDNEKD